MVLNKTVVWMPVLEGRSDRPEKRQIFLNNLLKNKEIATNVSSIQGLW